MTTTTNNSWPESFCIPIVFESDYIEKHASRLTASQKTAPSGWREYRAASCPLTVSKQAMAQVCTFLL